jgi:predicted aldo/keto reductase-like oxidoreductase
MRYRRFGRTELQMPVFSCGGMRYQHKWQDVPLADIPAENQRNLEATIHRAFELGINHIETARAYGSSEMQLGLVLPQLPRDRLIVQTKVVVTDTPKIFRETFERSLKLLNLDYVDLLSVHGINTDSHIEACLAPGGLLDVIHEFQAQGKVRFVGFSTHGPTDVITRAVETNQFDYFNVHWYYINQLNWPAIAAATARDMGVFIISPSDKGGHLHTPPPKLVDLCAPLSPMVFNNLFCLSHPEVHTLSLGAAQPSDFDEHMKTLDLLDRPQDYLPPILDQLEQTGIATFGADWWHNWRNGLPRPEQTPDHVNIPLILWLRNLALAYDMTEYAKARYNLLGGAASHWFPGARAEVVDDQAMHKLLQASPFADQIPQLLRETHALLGGETVKRLSQQD